MVVAGSGAGLVLSAPSGPGQEFGWGGCGGEEEPDKEATELVDAEADQPPSFMRVVESGLWGARKRGRAGCQMVRCV